MDTQNEGEKTEAQSKSGLFGSTQPAPLQPTPAPVQAAPVPPAEPEVVEPEAPPVPQVNERELLMQRARLMGIEFSPNIGTETLRQRISAKLDAAEAAPEPEDDQEDDVSNEAQDLVDGQVDAVNALTGQPANAPKKSFRQALIDEQMRLIRCRITCMDPKKKDLQGEIFTLANEYIGTVRKFIPFGEVTDDGYHIPFCLYTMLDERKFLNIRTTKDRRTGAAKVESSWAKEFALEILPQLTQQELDRLAIAQAAAGSTDSMTS